MAGGFGYGSASGDGGDASESWPVLHLERQAGADGQECVSLRSVKSVPLNRLPALRRIAKPIGGRSDSLFLGFYATIANPFFFGLFSGAQENGIFVRLLPAGMLFVASCFVGAAKSLEGGREQSGL